MPVPLLENKSHHPCPTELAEWMREYEQQHDVHEYEAHGWKVWPRLRLWMTFDLYGYYSPAFIDAPAKSTIDLTHSRLRVASRLVRDSIRSRLIDRRNSERPDQPQRDVVILTDSNRRQAVNGVLWNRMSDPLVEELSSRGVSCLVWETGSEEGPRHSPSAWISPALNLQSKLLARRSRAQLHIPAPPWFAEFSNWFRPMAGREISWQEALHHINYVTVTSRVFEGWLRRIGAKTLCSDCWYAPCSMAAALAARRVGIKVVDFQHGLQAPFHFAYRHWTKVPESGYEVVPDIFWFWGQVDCDSFRESNELQAELLVGGNQWLNKWRSKPLPAEFSSEINAARSLRSDSGRTVLVSFSLPVEPHVEILAELIRHSPNDWSWLIRLHPVMRGDTKRIERCLTSSGNATVNVEQATNLPLFALLQVSDVHVTRNSTCALEAMPFGIPTVVFHEEGLRMFRPYVESGAMIYETEPEKIIQAIQGISGLLGDTHIRDAGKVFASCEQASASIESLMQIIG